MPNKMTPYYSGDEMTIYHGDCREILPQLPYGSLTATVTDPPYGTGGWRRTEAGAGDDPSGSLIREAWDDGSLGWLRLVQGPVLTFWPAQHTRALLDVAIETGRTKHRTLYMRKHDPKPQVGGRIRWSMEPIWALSEDGFLLYGGEDVIDASTPRVGRDADAVGHPYQKPEAVMVWIVSKLHLPYVVIVDPFMGSGTTLVAAKRLGKTAIGIEAEERYCEIAAKRLSQGALPLEFSA